MQKKNSHHWTFPTSKMLLLVVIGLIILANTSCKQFAARVMMRSAMEFYNKDSYSKACPLFKTALDLRPNDMKLKQSLGYCYMAMYQPDDPSAENEELVQKAAQIFLDLLSSNPANKLAEEALISLYLNSSHYNEAVAYLHKRLEKNPQDSQTIREIASIYIRTDDLETAFDWYKKWAEVEPTNPLPYYSICSHCWRKAYCEVNRCEDPNLSIEQRQAFVMEGLAACEKALEIDPEHAESLAYINLIYRAKAKWVDYGNPKEQEKSIQIAKDYYERAKEILERRKREKEATQQQPSAAPATP